MGLIADVAPVNLFWNTGLSDSRVRLASSSVLASGAVVHLRRITAGQGLRRWVDSARHAVRERIGATFSAELAPFARALVLGETDLATADREAFRRSGLAHLLAVSGTHLVLVVVALGRAIRSVLARIESVAAGRDVGRYVAAFCALLAWLYADFAGGGGSAYRAAAMLSCVMVARAAGRRPDAKRSFAWSLGAGAAVDPLAVCDLSFVLSLGATAGLLVVRQPVKRLLAERSGVLRLVGSAVIATSAAMAGCAPVLLAIGPQLPLLGIAANVIAAPVGELAALPACLLHAVLWWAPAAEQGIATVASGALAIVRAVAHAAGAVEATMLVLPKPTPEQLAVLAVACCALGLWRRRPVRLRVAALGCATLVALEAIAVARGVSKGQLRVSVLDVGQGDAVLIDLPDGRAMMVDAGGILGSPVDTGRRVLLPVLRARRRRQLDIVVITHPHPDHYGGFVNTLAELQVGEVWHTGQGEDEAPLGRLATMLRAARQWGIPTYRPAQLCGSTRHFGAAQVEVLGPCPGYDPDKSANDNSIILRLQYGHQTALLVGDAEAAQEGVLLSAQGGRLKAGFLKVGHHGSRSSTNPDFLAAVSPQLAAVSCGVRNRFGHPHAQTLQRLIQRDVSLLRTDRGGSITWQTDGQRVWISRPADGDD